MKIWIDLDNSPHVPFFVPIIRELEERGHSVVLTARDAFQVCQLADLHGLSYERLGHHYGKHSLLKAYGTSVRTLQLLPTALRSKPDLALSHGSRSQLFAAMLMGVPSLVILDYEFARRLTVFRPTWVMAPEVIPDSAIQCDKRRLLRYPGIKEDVYVPSFTPDPSIKAELGINEESLLVTMRPPANEAHYHNPESEKLLDGIFDMLAGIPEVTVVLLPRNQSQEAALRSARPELFASRKVIVPDHAVDGLNLIWHSDAVFSGGGTMNREAAALQAPVYSIFRGQIGAVDRHLVRTGRLTLLESVKDIQTRVKIERRRRTDCSQAGNPATLKAIVDHVVDVVQPKSVCPSAKITSIAEPIQPCEEKGLPRG